MHTAYREPRQATPLLASSIRVQVDMVIRMALCLSACGRCSSIVRHLTPHRALGRAVLTLTLIHTAHLVRLRLFCEAHGGDCNRPRPSAGAVERSL